MYTEPTLIFTPRPKCRIESGIDFILRTVALELNEHGFNNIDYPATAITVDELDYYREFLQTYPTYITVHLHVKSMDGKFILWPWPKDELRDLTKTDVRSHYLVTGRANTGRSVLAEVVKHVIETFAPKAKIHLIDTDDHSYSFYKHKSDVERAQHVNYIKNLNYIFGKAPTDLGNF